VSPERNAKLPSLFNLEYHTVIEEYDHLPIILLFEYQYVDEAA
jgi:hypothetical protein